ncbi:DUF979 domain-containing protein, partial [Bacillus thuringiensis]|nr:DUF979 domain-containing protein [Bacillus thuringiensis]
IKAQVPIALSIFIINMFIMYGLVYRYKCFGSFF